MRFLLTALLFFVFCRGEAYSVDGEHSVSTNAFTSTLGISANPASANIITGTGEAQKYFEDLLGVQHDHGFRVGGVWVGNIDWLISGGADPGKVGLNSLLILDGLVDLEKVTHWWKGGSIGVEFLQFNGSPVNRFAGSVQGYDGLSGPSPHERTELYELWFRQEFFEEKLVVRVGKSVPTYDFGNVTKPVTLSDRESYIPATSGLLYTPIHKNPTKIGAMPGYYNSAYGATTTFEPIKWWYLSHGIYDGNQARGVQTGLVGPRINGYYFNILETGFSWHLSEGHLPGKIGLGAWNQTGRLHGPRHVVEDGTHGFYLFGSQRVWYQNPGKDSSGIVTFFQYGKNESRTLIINEAVGAGLTAFGLVPGRVRDSMGAGAFLSFLNPHHFHRSEELMAQAYYQAHIWDNIYAQPALSYIPNPGENPDLSDAWAATFQVTVLF